MIRTANQCDLRCMRVNPGQEPLVYSDLVFRIQKSEPFMSQAIESLGSDDAKAVEYVKEEATLPAATTSTSVEGNFTCFELLVLCTLFRIPLDTNQHVAGFSSGLS